MRSTPVEIEFAPHVPPKRALVTRTSIATGNWNAAGTWDTGVPAAGEDVVIAAGTTVTINTTPISVASLTVNGSLVYDATARAVTVTGPVTINAGGTFATGAAGPTTHSLSLSGNLTNNGTLDFSTNANATGASITFTGATSNTFGGTGGTTDIRTLVINKGTSNANVLELNPTNFSVQGTVVDGLPMAYLTLTNGTLKISGSFTLAGRTFTAAAFTIGATTGFWLNNPNYTVSGQGASSTMNGLLRISQGTFNIGTGTGNSMGFGNNSTVVVEGGAVNATGRFGVNSAGNNLNYTQTNGTITVCTIGNASSTLASMDLGTGVGADPVISGGTVIVQINNTSGTPRDARNEQGNSGAGITGGTIQLGNASSGAAKTYRINGILPNIVVNNASAGHTCLMGAPAFFFNSVLNVTINTGCTFNLGTGANNLLLMNGSTMTNNGTLISNASANRFFWLNPGASTYQGTGVGSGTTTSWELEGASLTHLNTTNLVVRRVNLFTGNVINANRLTLGPGDATNNVIQIGNGGVGPIGTAAGTFDVAPAFNLGAGGQSVLYLRTLAARTTGPEINPTRVVVNLTVDDSTDAGVPHPLTISGGDVTSVGAVTLTNGRVITGANKVIANGTLTRTAGYVDGFLQKPVAVGTPVLRTFEVGDVNAYSPVDVTFASVTGAGNLIGKATGGDHGSIGTSGLDPSKSVNRNWTLTNLGTVFTTYDAVYNFVAADLDGGTNTANLVTRKYDAPNWSYTTPGVRNPTNTQALGMTSFSDYQLAEAATHTITSTAGPGGTIAPLGATIVPDNGSQTYTIAPSDKCHYILDVKVDGVSVGAVASYTFNTVITDHTIDATFGTFGPFTITAIAGAGGSITPSGPVAVNCGDAQTFTIAASDKCHYILDVKVDGVSVGAVGTYTFTDVQANHTIDATFGTFGPFTITATAGAGGTITPSGAVSVNCGDNQSFSIAANVGYTIQDVVVDAVSVGPTGSYTFGDVQNNHTISASFVAVVGPVQNTDTGIYYTQIQAAISDPLTLNGHHIVASAGSYNPIVLNKRLDIRGAQAGVPGCGRVTGSPDPSVESIITGPGRLVELITGSAGSTLNGFSFIGGTRQIESTSGPLDNLTINYNHFAGFTSNAIFLNDPGLDVTVDNNNVDGASHVGGDGLVHLDTDSFNGFWLTNNCIGNAAAGSGFFVDGNHNVNQSTRRPLIDRNRLYSHTTNVGANLGTRAFNRGIISNNTVELNAFDGIQGGIQDTRITGNTFRNNGRTGLVLTSFGNLGVDRGGQRDTISGNFFLANGFVNAGFGYAISATQAAGNAATNHANFNDIVGNRVGASYAGTERFDVGCNWWGDINGPDYPPANPNPPGDDLVASNPAYYPWLDGSITGTPSCNQTIKHTITATAGPGGTISPSGAVIVSDGGSQTFTIAASDKCHAILDVKVDGVSQGPISSYTFTNVTADHTIDASFSTFGPFTITATAGPGGSITPSGAVSVICGASQTFSIAASDKCHAILDVKVDGVSVGAVSTYTFTDVQANHTIDATFSTFGPFTITATAGPGGSITPSGPVLVNCGATQTFDIAPSDKCHAILDVKVDGVSVGAVASYTFSDVQANHTIDASFSVRGPFTVTASAGAGGTVTPAGANSVACGASITFTIAPADKCHLIAGVKVDGVSVGAVATYTFTDVQANHTIDATFSGFGPFTITATAGPGGSITPSGAVSVNCGANQTFSIAPSDKCHAILDVKVDGVSVGPVATYTFIDVQANHTIDASFSTFGPFTITATAGPGGSITPSGAVSVDCGDSQTFSIVPADKCHAILDVKVDGFSQGPISTYTFTDVQANHTIDATFSGFGPFTITATAGPGGSIAPSGAVSVNCGDNQSFTITPNAGFAIADVKVDNVSVGPVATYTFTDVQANHTIAASFVDVQCPSVTVLSPNGGEIVFIGSVIKLAWTATDNVGVTDVDLWISRDNGATYEKVASGIANNGTFLWTVTGPGTNIGPDPVFTALFKVDAHDAAANTCSDVSDNPWAIFDLVTSTLVRQFVLAPVVNGIELRWTIADRHLFSGFSIERSNQAGVEWATIEVELSQEGEATVALDRTAESERTYQYRLIGTTASGQRVTLGEVSGTAGSLIKEVALGKVSPNPSFGAVRIEYAMPREGRVRLGVVDVQGREVALLVDGSQRAGRYQASWNGETDRGPAAVGVYFVRYQALGKSLTRRIVITR